MKYIHILREKKKTKKMMNQTLSKSFYFYKTTLTSSVSGRSRGRLCCSSIRVRIGFMMAFPADDSGLNKDFGVAKMEVGRLNKHKGNTA